MHPELEELDRRIHRSITRIPDRLSTPKGEAMRLGWALCMANVMGGALIEERMLVCLPVHPHLWTDPVVIRFFIGFVVLDHPTVAGQLENALRLNSRRVAIHDCPRWWSLYEGRAPRLVVCPDDGKVVQLSDLCNRLTHADWHGPWEAPPSLAYAPGSSASAGGRSFVTVMRTVDPAWVERVANN